MITFHELHRYLRCFTTHTLPLSELRPSQAVHFGRTDETRSNDYESRPFVQNEHAWNTLNLGLSCNIGAKSCIVYGKPTRSIMRWAEETPIWFHGVSRVSQDRMGLPLIGSLGGVTVRDAAGQVIGAVGVAGEAGPNDEALAVLGIESAEFQAQTE